MLNSASDYEYVNVSDFASRIHGNILPVVAPTSSYTALDNLEDILFLTEAYYERMKCMDVGTNNYTVSPRTLEANNLCAIQLNTSRLYDGVYIPGPYPIGYGNDGSYFFNKNTTYPNQLVTMGYNTLNLGNYLQNYSLSGVEVYQPYSGLRPAYTYAYEPLSNYHVSIPYSEYLRAKYWEFDNMSKLLCIVRKGDFATRVTSQYYNSDGQLTSTFDEGLAGNVMDTVIGYSKDSYGHTYKNKDTDADYKSSFFTFPHAKSAVLIYHAYIDNTDGSSSQWDNYPRIWTTYDVEVDSDGSIKVPSDLIHKLVDKAANIAGGTMRWATLDSFYLLVDFEFPARLDGISWNWQPQLQS